MKLDWMKEVDWKEGLTEELRMVLVACGEEALLALLESLNGHRIYVSRAPIHEAQRKYVKKFARVKSTRKIAFEMGASESFVQRVLSEMDNENQD